MILSFEGNGSLRLAIMYLPTLVSALPSPSHPNISYGAPVWSLELVLETAAPAAAAVTELAAPINITFPHTTSVSLLSYLYKII